MKTLSISGDGGFLFSAMELETAVRMRLNLMHTIWLAPDLVPLLISRELVYAKKTPGLGGHVLDQLPPPS
jgi:acetolactate synthase I/II/III large subunit